MGKRRSAATAAAAMNGMYVSLTLMTLLEGCAMLLPQARHACHIDPVDRVNVRAGAHALHHAVGDDGPHAGERHRLCWQAGKFRRRHLRHLRWGHFSTALFGRAIVRRLRRTQYVVLADTPTRASACDAAQVDAMFFGNAASKRRRADPAHLRHLRSGPLAVRADSWTTCGGADLWTGICGTAPPRCHASPPRRSPRPPYSLSTVSPSPRESR